MTIRDSLINLIGGEQFRQQRLAEGAVLHELYDAYQRGRYMDTPQQLAARLSEYTGSTAVMNLLRQMQSGNGWYIGDTEAAREYQIQESRQQWLYSPLGQWAVNVWTSYGLGESVTVTPNDESDAAQERWDYTWENSRIFDSDRIHELSNYVCVDGNDYLVAFHSVADGSTIFEQMNTDEITEIVSDPDDRNNILYYKREYMDTDLKMVTCYYPDYHAFFYHREDLKKAKLPEDAAIMVSEAMTQNNGTSTTILHVAHNRKDSSSPYGWPILGLAAPYLGAHKEFVETRLTVARNKASFVRELTVQGGSRGVASVKGKFDSQLGSTTSTTGAYVDANPAPVGGSGTMIHNQGITHTDLPMTTGAGDADTDNDMFAWMALIGCGLFPTTAGLDTSRWATALQMDKTQAVQWSRYQAFWAAQFEKMVEICLLAAEEWGGETFEDKTSKVSIDTLSLVDFPGVVPPIAQMLGAMGSESGLNEQAKLAITKALWTPVLTALGAENVQDVLSDELLGILSPEERAKLKKAEEEAKKTLAANPPPVQPETPAEPTAETYHNKMAELAYFNMGRKAALAEKEKSQNE